MAKKRASLLTRKRGTDPRRTQRAYLRGLSDKRHDAARRKDRESYDRYHAERFLRLFPS